MHIDFRGQRFTAPFKCLNCDRDISAEQFGFARSCGRCDVGKGPHSSRTRLCENGHIVDLLGFPIAPLSPDGDPDWMVRIRPFGGGPCYCKNTMMVQ